MNWPGDLVDRNDKIAERKHETAWNAVLTHLRTNAPLGKGFRAKAKATKKRKTLAYNGQAALDYWTSAFEKKFGLDISLPKDRKLYENSNMIRQLQDRNRKRTLKQNLLEFVVSASFGTPAKATAGRLVSNFTPIVPPAGGRRSRRQSGGQCSIKQLGGRRRRRSARRTPRRTSRRTSRRTPRRTSKRRSARRTRRRRRR